MGGAGVKVAVGGAGVNVSVGGTGVKVAVGGTGVGVSVGMGVGVSVGSGVGVHLDVGVGCWAGGAAALVEAISIPSSRMITTRIAWFLLVAKRWMSINHSSSMVTV